MEEKEYLELNENNFGLSHCKCLELMGNGFADTFDFENKVSIQDSGKDTKKTYNTILYYLMLMANIKGFNAIIFRNTVALMKKSTIPTVRKVLNSLINDHGLVDFIQILVRETKGAGTEKFNWIDGREIRFMAFENEVSGTDVSLGFWGKFLLEEPMERDIDPKFDYSGQKAKFKELQDTLERGVPQDKYIKWPCCNKEEKFNFTIDVLFNDWDENHWINTDIIQDVFPWSKEYENWIMEDIKNNYKKVVIDNNYPFVKGVGVKIIRTTKFINEYRNIKNDDNLIRNLISGDPYERTATIGAPYEASDPTIFMWRKMLEHEQKYSAKDFETDIEKVIKFGFDGGKGDNNVLAIGLFKKIDDKYRIFIPFAPSYKIDKKKKNDMNKLEVHKLIYSWLNEALEKYNVDKEWIVDFMYDDHEELTANLYLEWKQLENKYNFDTIPAVKNGWYDIEHREKIINWLYLTDQLIINWEEMPEAYKEYFRQQYFLKNGEKKRDEIHFPIDFQNAIEYLVQGFLDWLELPDNL